MYPANARARAHKRLNDIKTAEIISESCHKKVLSEKGMRLFCQNRVFLQTR